MLQDNEIIHIECIRSTLEDATIFWSLASVAVN